MVNKSRRKKIVSGSQAITNVKKFFLIELKDINSHLYKVLIEPGWGRLFLLPAALCSVTVSNNLGDLLACLELLVLFELTFDLAALLITMGSDAATLS